MTFTLIFLVLAALGHAAFWIGLVNRWHSTGFPRKFVKGVTLLFYAGLILPPLALARQWAASPEWMLVDWRWQLDAPLAYGWFCAAYGAAHLALWAPARLRSLRNPAEVRLDRENVIDMEQRLGASPARGLRTQIFSRLPANQLWQLHVSEYSLRLPKLDPRLAGLSICHWSDLHISGRIDRAYFEEVVRITNELKVDLIALTGDICDAARHIDWICEAFASASARLGKYFILGNHDLRTKNVGRLRAAMVEASFVDLGGRWQVLQDHGILLAGNEWPWFASNENLNTLPTNPSEPMLRVLLSHSPDQLRWARARGFDLMLAGHTHGGQIRFPLIGPVLCPSRHGTRYAGGFYSAPPTLLHVSRGTASLMPYRFNCPPEITRLELLPQN